VALSFFIAIASHSGTVLTSVRKGRGYIQAGSLRAALGKERSGLVRTGARSEEDAEDRAVKRPAKPRAANRGALNAARSEPERVFAQYHTRCQLEATGTRIAYPGFRLDRHASAFRDGYSGRRRSFHTNDGECIPDALEKPLQLRQTVSDQSAQNSAGR
jgi:hypothetical protein